MSKLLSGQEMYNYELEGWSCILKTRINRYCSSAVAIYYFLLVLCRGLVQILLNWTNVYDNVLLRQEHIDQFSPSLKHYHCCTFNSFFYLFATLTYSTPPKWLRRYKIHEKTRYTKHQVHYKAVSTGVGSHWFLFLPPSPFPPSFPQTIRIQPADLPEHVIELIYDNNNQHQVIKTEATLTLEIRNYTHSNCLVHLVLLLKECFRR